MNPPADEKKDIDKLSDEVKRKAIEAAQGIKDVAEARRLAGITETTDEMRAGSPRSPGFNEHSGKTIKPRPESPSPTPSPSPSPSPAPLAGGGNVFEQALSSKLSEIEASEKSRETSEPGGGMDL